MKLAATIVMRIVALFYLYGAAIHIFNIAGFSGFDWRAAPLKWQVLDISYLILDLVVVCGLISGWKTGTVAFYIAVPSQIVLYTILRDWITDVPAEFALGEEQSAYLTTLVIFHCITLALVTAALWIRRRTG